MKLYAKYNQRHIIDGNFTQDTSLNGFYDLSFFLTYPEYQIPTLTVTDGINTNAGKFLIAEYDENVISQENIDLYLASIPSEFNLTILSAEEAKNLLREVYREEIDGKFVLSEETTFMEQVYPANYLTIE